MRIIKNAVAIAILATVTYSNLSNAQADPVYDAFEAYKSCIKSLKNEQGATITPANYTEFCQPELARLKGVSQESFPAIEKNIIKWLSQ